MQSRLPRFKLKQMRKRGPKVEFLVSSETDSKAQRTLIENKRRLSNLAEKLYDEVWPKWREHFSVQVSFQFLEEDQMQEINRTYREVDSPTDVLTFPLYEENGSFKPVEGPFPMTLGDIVICPSVIQKNALSNGVSTTSELALVIFHGLLHLLAWDHDTLEKEAKMWEVQEKYRDLFLAECK